MKINVNIDNVFHFDLTFFKGISNRYLKIALLRDYLKCIALSKQYFHLAGAL